MKKARISRRKEMLEVLKQFRVILRSIKRHYQWVERQCGLGGAHLWTLAEIAASPGLTVNELAGQLAIHRSTASNMLRRLEELGFVAKKRAAGDQRVVRLRATRKGRAILKRAPCPHVGLLQQALLDLPMTTLSVLHKQLGAVIGVIKNKDSKARTIPLADI